jgi:hypothetical protein
MNTNSNQSGQASPGPPPETRDPHGHDALINIAELHARITTRASRRASVKQDLKDMPPEVQESVLRHCEIELVRVKTPVGRTIVTVTKTKKSHDRTNRKRKHISQKREKHQSLVKSHSRATRFLAPPSVLGRRRGQHDQPARSGEGCWMLPARLPAYLIFIMRPVASAGAVLVGKLEIDRGKGGVFFYFSSASLSRIFWTKSAASTSPTLMKRSPRPL